LAVRFTAVVQGKDVGVVETCRDLDLAQEALTADRGGEFRAEDLEGDLTIELLILGEVERPSSCWIE
jgi:hypothetical protein